MKVVILCGGQGTRLREETEYRPKPMVEIGGKPILWHIMKLYAQHDFRQFVLCLGYRGTMIKEYFLNYEAMSRDFTVSLGSRHKIVTHDEHHEQDFEVTLAETGLNTMTGGRLHRVRRYLDREGCMLTYGDGVSDVNIRALYDFHRSHGKAATVTVVRPTSRFGIIELEGERVAEFVEKPQLNGWASAGFFVLSPRALEFLDGTDDEVFERGPLERLSEQGELMAYRHDGFFFAMDTYREFVHLNQLWDSGEAPWKVWER